uniref:Uncharacterized protein n=1 Tax=Panagrolaimus sp. ES5 TaxID=591445 RepID=A0AC34G8M1_9BILA
MVQHVVQLTLKEYERYNNVQRESFVKIDALKLENKRLQEVIKEQEEKIIDLERHLAQHEVKVPFLIQQAAEESDIGHPFPEKSPASTTDPTSNENETLMLPEEILDTHIFVKGEHSQMEE